MGNWWRVDQAQTRSSARWLGVFSRRLPLVKRAPNRLVLPSFSASAPESLSLFSPASIDTGTYSASMAQQPAVNLLRAGQSREPARGTVRLADILLLNEDPLPAAAAPATSEDRMWEKVRLNGDEPEVPLARRLAYLLRPPLEAMLSSHGPMEWPGAFFPYQAQGIEVLVSRVALLLADDMGLGKTVQVIAALRILIHQRRCGSALIVVPATLVSQWRKELHLWAPELRISTVQGPVDERAYQWATAAHIFIVSYETLRADFTSNPNSPPRRRTWDVVVIDEAQKIKNRDTEVSRKCKQIPRRRAWALTGTPLENSPDDLASILEFARPLGQQDRIPRLAAGPGLRAIHKELQLRRKKADVLPQLPPKTVATIALPLSGEQRLTYDKAEKEGVLQLTRKGEAAT